MSGESDWVFVPNYENVEKAYQNGFTGIAGINLDLRKPEYVRSYVPLFVTQRTPDPRRPDIQECLKDMEMLEYDRFEWMCRNHGLCGNDRLYVSRTPDKFIDANDPFVPPELPEDNRAFKEFWGIE